MTSRFPDPDDSGFLWFWVVIAFLLCVANVIGAVAGYSVPCDYDGPILCPGGSLGRGAFIAGFLFAFFLGFFAFAAATGRSNWFVQLFEDIP